MYFFVVKPRRSKDGNTGTGENSTPGDAENSEDPVGATSEHGEEDNGQDDPDKQAMPNDQDDDSFCNVMEHFYDSTGMTILILS